MDPGEWIRLRVVWSGWLQRKLDLEIPGCEMELLAKDGIYISDYPRQISTARIVPGGRADIMVRCMEESTTYTVHGAGQDNIANIKTFAGPIASTTSLEPWASAPPYPAYLTDLRSQPASPDCACTTEMDQGRVNGRKFNHHEMFHSSYLGAVVERLVVGYDHPYHQHVYPFQMISGFGSNGDYDIPGDWHDTVQGSGVIRYQPTVFSGKVMLHCHRLTHEDTGMMAIEQISADTTGTCTCVRNIHTWIRVMAIPYRVARTVLKSLFSSH